MFSSAIISNTNEFNYACIKKIKNTSMNIHIDKLLRRKIIIIIIIIMCSQTLKILYDINKNIFVKFLSMVFFCDYIYIYISMNYLNILLHNKARSLVLECFIVL